ncbi:DNA primase [Limobrevibacterium gyesilva]|uniref:DNA primase n=1 Tax=Limobrevibacterium gyesilva TaxID=2991712 RepID=A0AA41YQG5_9PROT|nr:DNA primase [Limobrevibacterium gyesilva]MCW3476846.1 DNA primase [Limobrevibacterium gyesilva]
MALPAGFLDELRARTPLAGVIGRRVRLARSGRNWKGCCPFHGEKTPSFYVYDDHFHCFGCGAHGDAISFVMQSQGTSFPEAVEQLAGEAGMDVPKPSPGAAEAERRRLDLHGVLEAASQAFQRRLRLPEGARALDYLRGRGLAEQTIQRFGLGWSGEGRGALAADLAREGIAPAMLIEAGLMKPPEDGRPAYDLFFNRVMFPIRDRRGRTISFGGRILGDGQPKYVNGPETALFSKRRTLFALDLAREAARAGGAVVAVEGYMDVIALHQAGFAGAVAPLGTALTEEQLEELWRLSPMPVLCFDGDAAGGRAAARAAELALPLLTAERSLKLATLPSAEDPDTLVRRQGPAAFQAVLDAARPLAEALFGLLREGAGDATPEQRAALRTRLEAAAGQIRDKSLASEYRRALMERFYARRPAPARRGGAPGQPKPPPAFHRPALGVGNAAAERARNLVAILLNHPALLHDVEEAFGTIDLPPGLAALRDAILHWGDAAQALDSAALMTHLSETGLAADAAQALSAVPYPLPACAAPEAMPAEAEAGWWHIFGLMHRGRLEEEVAAAMRDMAEHADEATQRRLIALCTARNALRQGEQGMESEP